MSRTLRVLVLYWHPKGTEMRLGVRRHLHVLDVPGTRVLYRNAFDPAPRRLAWTKPDLCVLATTFLGVRWNYDFEEYGRRFAWIAGLDCPKVALPQDEYDHSAVLEDWLLELGATTVYSCFGARQRRMLYPRLGERVPFHETLTGFIDEKTADSVGPRIASHSERRFDVVYRAKQLPYWFGSHGQLKHRIAEAVQERAAGLGLRTDISTRPEDTVYGDGWLDFLLAARAVIGAESGSSVLDERGEIQRRISRLLAAQPDLTFEEVDAQMPSGWDSYDFFAISPRHLEAVVTKTAQVLVEGSYSGVLEPERHYIPVRRDFSNLSEALGRLRDVAAVEAMAERAYEDVYLSGRYDLGVLADQLRREARTRPVTTVALPLALARRPSTRARAPSAGKPLRQLAPHMLTLVEALARQSEARRLFVASLRGRVSVSPPDVARELILLRVLARIRSGGEWSLDVENAGGAVRIETRAGGEYGEATTLDGPIESVAWSHSAVAQFVPIYPRHPRRGWIALGLFGRYEFNALAELARTDPAAARALLARALEG